MQHLLTNLTQLTQCPAATSSAALITLAAPVCYPYEAPIRQPELASFLGHAANVHRHALPGELGLVPYLALLLVYCLLVLYVIWGVLRNVADAAFEEAWAEDLHQYPSPLPAAGLVRVPHRKPQRGVFFGPLSVKLTVTPVSMRLLQSRSLPISLANKLYAFIVTPHFNGWIPVANCEWALLVLVDSQGGWEALTVKTALDSPPSPPHALEWRFRIAASKDVAAEDAAIGVDEVLRIRVVFANPDRCWILNRTSIVAKPLPVTVSLPPVVNDSPWTMLMRYNIAMRTIVIDMKKKREQQHAQTMMKAVCYPVRLALPYSDC